MDFPRSRPPDRRQGQRPAPILARCNENAEHFQLVLPAWLRLPQRLDPRERRRVVGPVMDGPGLSRRLLKIRHGTCRHVVGPRRARGSVARNARRQFVARNRLPWAVRRLTPSARPAIHARHTTAMRQQHAPRPPRAGTAVRPRGHAGGAAPAGRSAQSPRTSMTAAPWPAFRPGGRRPGGRSARRSCSVLGVAREAGVPPARRAGVGRAGGRRVPSPLGWGARSGPCCPHRGGGGRVRPGGGGGQAPHGPRQAVRFARRIADGRSVLRCPWLLRRSDRVAAASVSDF